MINEGSIQHERGTAYISGSFTNWEPRKMMQIDELCANLQGKQDAMKNNDRRNFYHDQIKLLWRKIIQKQAQYKDNEV